jgi:WD40 repeat protein
MRHSREVKSVAVSPDGQQIASAGFDQMLKIWDSTTGVLRWETYEDRHQDNYMSSIDCIHFDHLDNRIVYTSPDQLVRVRILDSWQEVYTINELTDVTDLALSPKKPILAIATLDYLICFWNLSQNTPIRSVTTDSPPVAIAFSPTGSTLAVATQEFEICLLDIQSGIILNSLPGHSKPIRAIAYSPDGRRLASAGFDGRILLWDTSSWVVRHHFTLPGVLFGSLAFSPDRPILAVGGSDGKITLWDLENHVLIASLSGSRNASGGLLSPVVSLCFSPDGTKLVSGGTDCAVRVWDTGTWSELL